jgi:hypothetical protein
MSIEYKLVDLVAEVRRSVGNERRDFLNSTKSGSEAQIEASLQWIACSESETTLTDYQFVQKHKKALVEVLNNLGADGWKLFYLDTGLTGDALFIKG